MKIETLIITGPSGVGKDEVTKKVNERLGSRAKRIVTYTSRPPRTDRPGIPDEIDGVDYYFVSKQKFEEMISNGEFVEYVEVYNQYKGTTRKSLENNEGRISVLRIDPTAAAKIAVERNHNVAVVYLGVSSLFELKRRVEKRKTYERSVFNNRLREDWAVWKNNEAAFRTCAHVIINREGEIEETVDQVMALLS